MSVKRFFAPSAREALRMVKEEFGGDAVVLANRSVEDGVEILAAPAAALATLSAPAEPPTAPPPLAAPPARQAPTRTADPIDDEGDFQVSLSQSVARRHSDLSWRPFVAPRAEAPQPEPRRPSARPDQPGAEVRRAPRSEAPAAEPRPAPSARRPLPANAALETTAPGGAPAPALPAQLGEELAGIRRLIERQLAGFAWGALARQSPLAAMLLGELLEAGFSGELARRLTEGIPADSDEASARAHIRSVLSRDLSTLPGDADLIDRGGVYALVGPTGVGKTTTTAKLAARCVVRNGADRLALLTTDSYRIGAHEQLRIYGRILGVSVHVIRDGTDLRQTLAELRNKHMVLIDTVGMSQRDRAVTEQAAMLMNAGDVKRLLLLNAGSRGETLDDVVRAYSGPDLAGAIVTKVDETTSLAPVLDVLVRNELDLFYVANGQRVPEDLHLPNRAYLLHRALRGAPADSPHKLDAAEAALLLAHSRDESLRREELRRG